MDRDPRIKELMEQCGNPNSMSLYSAFKQFENELVQEYERKLALAKDTVKRARAIKHDSDGFSLGD